MYKKISWNKTVRLLKQVNMIFIYDTISQPELPDCVFRIRTPNIYNQPSSHRMKIGSNIFQAQEDFTRYFNDFENTM